MFPRSALLLREEENSVASLLTFGCKVIDASIGGISVGSVTEIVGEAGAGKTQLCLFLALRSSLVRELGGLGGTCAYICTQGEGEFPIRRLNQMAQLFSAKYGTPAAEVLEKVFIEKCRNVEDCFDDLLTKVPSMAMSQGVKLLIIDRSPRMLQYLL